MGEILSQVLELFFKDRVSVLLILPGLQFVMCFLVLHSWIVRADPVVIARGLIHIHRSRLENMLTQEYLTEEARTIINLELRQCSLWKLTRLFIHRLQDLAVLFTAHFNERKNYLSLCCTWLSEREGQILFNRTWYKISLWFFWLGALISSAIVLTLVVIFFTV